MENKKLDNTNRVDETIECNGQPSAQNAHGQPSAQNAQNIGTSVKKGGKNRFFTTSNITKMALFSALAIVMGLISFPVPFLPSFLKFNFADFIFLIATFCLGTTAGSVVVIIKVAFSLFNSYTGFVGELADLLCGLALVLPAGLIYRKWRTFKGAIWGCTFAIVSSTLVGIICNWSFLVQLYVHIGGWQTLIAPTQAAFTLLHIPITVTQQNFYAVYLPICVLPFNLLRCIFASGVTLLVYKKLSTLLKKF